jgi:hypothetical protein
MNLDVGQHRIPVRVRARNVVVTNDLKDPPDTGLIMSGHHHFGGDSIILNLLTMVYPVNFKSIFRLPQSQSIGVDCVC